MSQPAPFALREIFDRMDFEAKLAQQQEPPIGLFQETLKRGNEQLTQGFEQGVSIQKLVAARVFLIDQLLQSAWHSFIPDDDKLALIAVGGYGRGELHPASDIDLMILLASDDHQYLHEPIEKLLVFLWDIGLEVGHSVRTLEDCVEESIQDISVATNLMEARLLEGSNSLFQQMTATAASDPLWTTQSFFKAKCEEQRARYRKYDNTGYNLEPNVKESPGGLRDIHMVGWVAKRHFGAKTLHELVSHGFLTEQEYRTLMDGEAFLWRVRFALHSLSRRREDRLLFDFQPQLAKLFGYQDRDHSLGVELFMQQYYRKVMELSRLNEMLLQLFQEAILFSDTPDEPEPINNRFQARNGFIEVRDAWVFQKTPEALLELFLLLQTHPELQGVRATTIRMIRDNVHLIDDHFRHSLTARSLFMEIMRQPRGITAQLRRMNRYGILAAYIPGFADIVGRMQYDLFHVYTVDEHTLTVVRNLRRFTVPEHQEEFPLCSRIIDTLPKPELIYLAGLFHDIGKGRGGDHSKLGARDALDFCHRHDLSNMDSRLVAWLVENHLLLSMTAQRKDISDPDEIQNFAERVADLTRLDYLYLLTVADARATNPQRWNTWRDALLKGLYLSTRRALQRGIHNPQAQDELIIEKQSDARQLLRLDDIEEKRITELWSDLGREYFLHNSADEIAWHTQEILAGDPADLPMIRLRRKTERGGTEIFIYGQDQEEMFACTTTLLDQLALNIQDARLITTDSGLNLNSYQILEQDGSTVADERRAEEIVLTLNAGLITIHELNFNVSRRVSRQQRHFNTDTQISFSQDPGNRRTVLRLVTNDRPGLLSKVGQAFTDCNVRLQNAKISTIGAIAEDIFFITTRDRAPISAEEQLTCLSQAIEARLG